MPNFIESPGENSVLVNLEEVSTIWSPRLKTGKWAIQFDFSNPSKNNVLWNYDTIEEARYTYEDLKRKIRSIKVYKSPRRR